MSTPQAPGECPLRVRALQTFPPVSVQLKMDHVTWAEAQVPTGLTTHLCGLFPGVSGRSGGVMHAKARVPRKGTYNFTKLYKMLTDISVWPGQGCFVKMQFPPHSNPGEYDRSPTRDPVPIPLGISPKVTA